MSLVVVLESKDAAGKHNVMERHIPLNNLPKLDNEDIKLIQADGDELEEIQILFKDTIPMPKYNRVVVWFGDLAATIYHNLRNQPGRR